MDWVLSAEKKTFKDEFEIKTWNENFEIETIVIRSEKSYLIA